MFQYDVNIKHSKANKKKETKWNHKQRVAFKEKSDEDDGENNGKL